MNDVRTDQNPDASFADLDLRAVVHEVGIGVGSATTLPVSGSTRISEFSGTVAAAGLSAEGGGWPVSPSRDARITDPDAEEREDNTEPDEHQRRLGPGGGPEPPRRTSAISLAVANRSSGRLAIAFVTIELRRGEIPGCLELAFGTSSSRCA